MFCPRFFVTLPLILTKDISVDYNVLIQNTDIMDENDFKLSWKQIISFLIICGGLYYITGSILMAAGIMLLLIIGVYALSFRIMERRKKKEKEKEEEEGV